MIALKHVLVATDFSPPADAALRYGRALARTFRSTLHVLHVHDNDFLKPRAADPSVVRAAAEAQLHDRLSDDDRCVLSAREVTSTSSEPADAITAYARLNHIDLIVTGTHGRRGMAHALTGSVAERVVRTAPCPVLTVRHPEHEFVRSEEDHIVLLKRILVATDFGDAADAALTYAQELGRRFGATLHLLHVTDNMYTRNFGREAVYDALPAEPQRTVDEAARTRLDEMAIDSHRNGLDAVAVVRTSALPALDITQYAQEQNIDLIVMGTHGRGALAHVFMGNVAERVVRLAPCPVLTVRHPHHEFVQPDALAAIARA